MVRIVADTSTMYSIGEVMALYEEFKDDEILNITIADGLSGTYQSACSAAELVEDGDITVINSATLCGPHRFIVETAVAMAKENKTLQEIVDKVHEMMAAAKSYLIPADFGYLRRGGRLSPLVSHVGQVAHLAPVMTQTDNGERLTIASVRRGFANAIKYVGKALEEKGIGKGWRVYITHGADLPKAEQALKILQPMFPGAVFEIHPLSPAFITQGGPSCVAVQVVHE